jgi:hypothetical protein
VTDYSYTGGIQTVTIGASGTYDIIVDGAEGGSGSASGPGLGAVVSGDIYLAAGTVLEIVVGGEGGSLPFSGGGGGGSFVIETNNGTSIVDTILAVAGGGGGGSYNSTGVGGGGVTTPTGGNGGGQSAGMGGLADAPGTGGFNGGGGGGFTGGDGAGPNATGSTGGTAGTSFSGGMGDGGGDGGFGGGGGGGTTGGGGGGGYGGGGGGNSGGGGGGSYLGPGVTLLSETGDTHAGNGDVNVAQVLCFLQGTRMMTPAGEASVETLRVGDAVLTVSGAARPITWIGHRVLDETLLAAHPQMGPVRILPGAFGQNLPARSLYLSPGHPVLVGADPDGEGGVLVPVMCLINGTSVAREHVDTVIYWHVELDGHDILLAEGLPAESFLDDGNRSWFENGADHALTNPDAIPAGLDARCRPVAVDGPLVEAERRRLDMLFAMTLEQQCNWPRFENEAMRFLSGH